MMKRIFGLLLALVMLVAIVPTAAAAEDEATVAADALYALGLFQGTGEGEDGKPIYDLDRAPTRHEAVTMLVRILGKEEEALSGTWDMPFTDVANWAKPYVGYAYANGLTSGTSDTTYSGNNTVTATQYLTFVLRALGYDSERDFKWNKAWELSDEIGLTDGRYNADTTEFLRGDVAIISYNSLSCEKYVNIFENIPEETQAQKKKFEQLKNAKEKYGIPDSPGGLTLSWDEARALVGQDIGTVKRYVKTLDDCVYYMCAAGYTVLDGDLKYSEQTDGGEEISWHFNYSPQAVFDMNKGNCGGTAGLVAYLLDGDYDEVGLASYRSTVNKGGHVVNYLKYGNMYYVFDMNAFSMSYSYGMGTRKNKDLNEAVKAMFGIAPYGKTYSYPAMMACTSPARPDGDIPTGWPLVGYDYQPKTYIAEVYSEKINIVYETPEEGYVYEFVEVSQTVLDKIAEIRNP